MSVALFIDAVGTTADPYLCRDSQEAVRPTQPISAPATHRFSSEFERAAQIAGVPLWWAADQALLQIIWIESRFDPEARSRSSSAFGLFQLLKGTWSALVPEADHGTDDVVWQVVGGFRYIRHRYGTPGRAHQFLESTMYRDPRKAPPDLAGVAQRWIDRGYVGY